MNDLQSTSDVVIIGGGPAGSTAGALLARAGHRVVLLEKTVFPRFHIGESLLPSEQRLFDRLGLTVGPAEYVRKAGADFVDERTGRRFEYLFADGMPGTCPYAWHVERSHFDSRLLDIAAADGADVRTGERVVEVEPGDGGVTVRSERGVHHARYVLDATGQDAFTARRARAIKPIRGFGVAAVFCHYEGLRPEVVAELEVTGNINIIAHDQGWAWIIPLRGEKLSFGVVSLERGVTTALLDRVVEASPLVQRLTEGTRRTEPRVFRNFSYRNTTPHGPRWACIGDASYFLDPVFSSGVSLAMVSAERAADRLGEALATGEEGAADLMVEPRRHMERAYDAFGALIHAFYHTKILEHLFFCDDPDPRMRAGLITMLAGYVWRDDNPFQNALLSGRRSRAHKSLQVDE